MDKTQTKLLNSLNPDERLDDLHINDYKIIQRVGGFCFGVDAVLLAHFARAKKGERCLDIGLGTGIVPILMTAYQDADLYYGIDIQEAYIEMAKRSIAYNGLQDKIFAIHMDVKEADKHFSKEYFDVITSNPPYFKNGLTSSRSEKYISRHETSSSFREMITVVKKLLKVGGRFYLIHRPARLAEIIWELKNKDLEPKKICLVQANKSKEASLVLIEAVRGGGEFLRIMPSLNIYDEKGQYTQEILDIYAGKLL